MGCPSRGGDADCLGVGARNARESCAGTQRTSNDTESADVRDRETGEPVVVRAELQSLGDDARARRERGMRVDDTLWFAGRSTRGNDECIVDRIRARLRQRYVVIGADDACGTESGGNCPSCGNGQALIERENGIARIPDVAQCCNECIARRQIHCDESGHACTLRAGL